MNFLDCNLKQFYNYNWKLFIKIIVFSWKYHKTQPVIYIFNEFSLELNYISSHQIKLTKGAIESSSGNSNIHKRIGRLICIHTKKKIFLMGFKNKCSFIGLSLGGVCDNTFIPTSLLSPIVILFIIHGYEMVAILRSLS